MSFEKHRSFLWVEIAFAFFEAIIDQFLEICFVYCAMCDFNPWWFQRRVQDSCNNSKMEKMVFFLFPKLKMVPVEILLNFGDYFRTLQLRFWKFLSRIVFLHYLVLLFLQAHSIWSKPRAFNPAKKNLNSLLLMHN